LFRKNWFEHSLKDRHDDVELVQGKLLEENFRNWNNITEICKPTLIRKLSSDISFKCIPEPKVLMERNTNDTYYEAPSLHRNPNFQHAFSLESDGKRFLNDCRDMQDLDKRKYMSIINFKYRKIQDFDKSKSIIRYKEKRMRRRHVCQIKYKVRQDLASRRLREKGKFVKSLKKDNENSPSRPSIQTRLKSASLLNSLEVENQTVDLDNDSSKENSQYNGSHFDFQQE